MLATATVTVTTPVWAALSDYMQGFLRLYEDSRHVRLMTLCVILSSYFIYDGNHGTAYK